MGIEGKGLKEKQEYYQRLLYFSPADLRSMVNAGIDFFEIRALGTAHSPASKIETTSRTYNVQEILAASNHLHQLIEQVSAPITAEDTPEALSELSRQLKAEMTQLMGKDYPVKSLIEYYIGSEKYRELRQELRDKKDRRSNKDLMLYHLLETDVDRPFPNFSQELFQIRDETGIVGLVERVGEIYQQGGEARKELEATISQHNVSDIFWITTSTDSARIREVAAKAKLLVA